MRIPKRILALLIPLLFSPAVLAADNGKPVQAATPAAPPVQKPFEFGDVEQKARELAGKPYVRDDAGMPEFLSKLDYDQYRDIRYKADKALWKDEGLPFNIQLFHRGFMFRDRVNINVIDQGVANRLAYNSELFDFGKNQLPSAPPADLGFAGLRFHHPLRHDDVYDEIAVFLGASYFRAVGLGQAYGLSARGLAIDTGLPKAEEFPIFREFWVVKPAKDARELTVYALLDSASVTGAYKFVIQPGLDLKVDVTNHVFFRKAVERFGIAPLTSMYFHGENTDRYVDDFRPEVHDSDGLLLGRSNGEWVWRPLNNPRILRISVFQDNKPVGFGLVKRDRSFDHYQDLEAHYHQRPSAWVETVGDWGAGSTYLIEIPSDAEKYDNIVSFWIPNKPTGPGKDYSFQYRLHFTLDEPANPALGKVAATRIGGGGTDALKSEVRKFVVDFKGKTLKHYGEKAKVDADISASSGKIDNVVVQKNTSTGGWRLSFELTPEKDKDPVELRGLLKSNGEILTETWVYQWSGK
ncbi:glucan biosynthesis protein [Methylococcus sp. EFPC2]|uniref:glucan biosynthesis protein n=1 Tax=Methylococcus sp. EFPC2 TaxID=2812648 RepID=UPI001F074BC7|nr:glucan biosynthesis protein G [Methylococcus sp. EFPC2]